MSKPVAVMLFAVAVLFSVPGVRASSEGSAPSPQVVLVAPEAPQAVKALVGLFLAFIVGIIVGIIADSTARPWTEVP